VIVYFVEVILCGYVVEEINKVSAILHRMGFLGRSDDKSDCAECMFADKADVCGIWS